MKHKVRLNERQLHNVIKTAVKRVLREQEELDDDPAFWGGIDDYPNAPSAEQQWDDYRDVQGFKENDMPYDEWLKKREDFAIEPQYHCDSDFFLNSGGLNAFQQDRHGKESMYAMNPRGEFARSNSYYNGYKHNDKNNPSIQDDMSLPDNYLNETIKRALRKTLRENIRDYNKIDDYLSHLGGVKVSRFYSDEDNLVISVLGNDPKKKQQVKEIMRDYGYSLYDCGANGDSLMMTFKK